LLTLPPGPPGSGCGHLPQSRRHLERDHHETALMIFMSRLGCARAGPASC